MRLKYTSMLYAVILNYLVLKANEAEKYFNAMH